MSDDYRSGYGQGRADAVREIRHALARLERAREYAPAKERQRLQSVGDGLRWALAAARSVARASAER